MFGWSCNVLLISSAHRTGSSGLRKKVAPFHRRSAPGSIFRLLPLRENIWCSGRSDSTRAAIQPAHSRAALSNPQRRLTGGVRSPEEHLGSIPRVCLERSPLLRTYQYSPVYLLVRKISPGLTKSLLLLLRG